MSEQTRRSWKTACCSQSAAVHMRSAVVTSVKPISWIMVNRVTDDRVRSSDYATAKVLLGRSSVVSRASRNMLGCWTKHHMTCLGLLRQQQRKGREFDVSRLIGRRMQRASCLGDSNLRRAFGCLSCLAFQPCSTMMLKAKVLFTGRVDIEKRPSAK
jgi:hypothetical protein